MNEYRATVLEGDSERTQLVMAETALLARQQFPPEIEIVEIKFLRATGFS